MAAIQFTNKEYEEITIFVQVLQSEWKLNVIMWNNTPKHKKKQIKVIVFDESYTL